MSTTAAATTTTGDKPVRRFPPPCWTQDEALALIQAYRDRWYALRRGYLRTADWDAVAEHVGRLCPGAVPPKTSAQCRHKMEKLRQRYRAEKQRALSFPGPHFISTWFYFQAMDSMEKNGSNNNNNQDLDTNTNTGIDPVYAALNPGRGIRFKPVVTATQTQLVTVASRENNNIRVSHNYPILEEDNDVEFENNPYYVETPKTQRLGLQNYATRFQPGFQSDRNMENSGIRPRKISKVGLNFNHDEGYWNEVNDGGGDDDEDDDDVWVKMGRDRGSDERVNRGAGRESFDGEFSRGVKRESDDSIGQIVGAIKLLADGFVKMERMKMDMVHEIEKARMEAEMKRNKMLLESQKQIVEAFVKGLSENKKQRQ